jgi:pyrroline-5-carboxylate reductase
MIKNLVLVGCGHMGYAMLKPWVENKAASHFWVACPRLESLHGLETRGVHHVAWPQALPSEVQADVVIFAVHPEILSSVMSEYKNHSALFISVAAGKTLASYEKILGPHARVIRAMPNLPAKIGAGVTTLVANKNVSAADRQNAEKLLSALGATAWLQDEKLMDAATAISGCGPAYFYLLTETLSELGQEFGLSPDVAAHLARETCIGSSLLWQKEDSSAGALYQSIAVKGGLTEAAISTLRKNDALKNLMRDALKSAVARADALAKDKN